MFLSVLGAASLGLVGNRIRGGLIALPGGDLPARVLGSLLGFGAVAAIAGVGWFSLVVAAAALVGDAVAGTDGKYETTWSWPSFARLGLYGFERLATVSIVLFGLAIYSGAQGWPILLLLPALLLCPVCYALAPYWPVPIKLLGIKARDGADSGFGEALWGIVAGVATVEACHGL